MSICWANAGLIKYLSFSDLLLICTCIESGKQLLDAAHCDVVLIGSQHSMEPVLELVRDLCEIEQGVVESHNLER